MKRIIFLWCLLVLIGCSSNKSFSVLVDNDFSIQQPSLESGVNVGRTSVVNGSSSWTPMVFSDFDESALAVLADNLNTGKVKRAAIVYPSKMKTLAQRIQNYLEIQTKQDVPMLSVELRNTEQVQYDLSQVIVTLYFN